MKDALARGVGAGALRSQQLSAPFQGVRSVTPPLDGVSLCRAYATKMRHDSAFCGLSAARIWGMPLPRSADDDRVHVSSPHGGPRPTGRGVRGFQHDPGRVEVVEVDGLRVFSPVETWLSLGRILTLPDLVAAADFILTPAFGSRDPALATLGDLLIAATRPRVIARPVLARAAAWAAVGPLSRPESLCRVLLMSAGIPEPVANLRISPLVTLDLAWPAARYGLDYLGDHHRSPTQFARDVARRELVRDLRWHDREVTRDDLFSHPHQLVLRVRSDLSQRGIGLSPVHPSKFVLPSP